MDKIILFLSKKLLDHNIQSNMRIRIYSFKHKRIEFILNVENIISSPIS